ncbi:MAG: tetratricopeptide repeat protein [Candidatus Eisenbacteria bacterium]|nr:tetratricopeptide repeat protein [Candidatus Eisenbacteria bacterium]
MKRDRSHAGRSSRGDRDRPARGRDRAAPRAPGRPPAQAPSGPAAVLPLRHPAVLVAILVAAVLVVVSVTYLIYDTDVWQHLTVGRAVWTLHRIPTTQVWTWPTYGGPDVNYAWGFETLLWPVWKLGGVNGLFAWRWITTLAAFGLLLVAARRMGARGLTPLVVAVLCALVYRQRSQVRPETLAAVLFAVEIWILETRRHGGRDHTWWLVPCALIWVNVHITYYQGFVLLGAHLADALLAARRARGRDDAARQEAGARARRLWRVGLAALAVSFLNPFGWRALAQPFEYFLFWRHEQLYRLVSELGPVDWSRNLLDGLILLLALWPVLLVWRTRTRGFDVVEVALAALFIPMALTSQRFLGSLALAAFPYLARDLNAWIGARRWPRWTAAAPARAALASTACVALAWPELSHSDPPLGVGMEWKAYPVAACDFIAAHDVRGRAFNHLRTGGYLLWRFWPDRGRLPFMDVHFAGTPELRARYIAAMTTTGAWGALDLQHRFDYALLARPQAPGDHLPDLLDADSTWAPVFVDDAAALYVRREGRLATLADSFGYRVLGAGRERLLAVTGAASTDSVLRARAAAELRRQVRASPTTALSLSFLANIALLEGRLDEARDALEHALASDPRIPELHLRLGRVALRAGRTAEAIAELHEELAARPGARDAELALGLAYRAAGDNERARAAYLRVLKRDPHDEVASALLRMLAEGGGGERPR